MIFRTTSSYLRVALYFLLGFCVYDSPTNGQGFIQVDQILRQKDSRLGSSANQFLSVDWDPLGTRLVTTSIGAIEIWDASSGVRLAHRDVEPTASDSLHFFARFSPDGKKIYTNSSGLKVLDASTGELLNDISNEKMETVTEPLCVDFSIGAFAHFSANGVVHVADLNSGKELSSIKVNVKNRPDALYLFDEGKRLAIFQKSGVDGPNLQIINLDKNNALVSTNLKGHRGEVLSWKLCPSSKLFITGSSDNTVRLWSLDDGESLGVLRGHTNPIVAMDSNANGETLVTVDTGNSLRVWDLRSKEQKYARGYIGSLPWKLAMSTDGALIALATQCRDQFLSSVRIFDWKSNTERGKVWAGLDTNRLTWDSTSRYVGCLGTQLDVDSKSFGLFVIDTLNGKTSFKKIEDEYNTTSFGSSPKSDEYFISNHQQTSPIAIGRFATLQEVSTGPSVAPHDRDIGLPYLWQWHPNGRALCGMAWRFVDRQNNIKRDLMIFDIDKKSTSWLGIRAFDEVGRRGPFGAFFSPNGKFIAIVEPGLAIEVWDIQLKKLHCTFPLRDDEGDYDRQLNCIAWTPDSNYLFAGLNNKVMFGSYRESVRGWSIEQKKQLSDELPELMKDCIWLSIHPNNGTIALADGTPFIKVWSLKGEKIQKKPGFLCDRPVRQVAFSPNGKYLAANGEGALVFWDLADGKKISSENFAIEE